MPLALTASKTGFTSTLALRAALCALSFVFINLLGVMLMPCATFASFKNLQYDPHDGSCQPQDYQDAKDFCLGQHVRITPHWVKPGTSARRLAGVNSPIGVNVDIDRASDTGPCPAKSTLKYSG